MNFDYGQLSQMGPQIDQVLSTLPYPIDKDELVQRAQQAGANPQVVGAMRQILPDKTFNSSQDIKKFLTGQQGQQGQQGQTRM
jgi:hypothetical protein